MSQHSPKYLLLVSADGNHNKYYKMLPNAECSMFSAEYGRVGASSQSKVYPIDKWNSVYRSKINKGYQDQSDIFFERKIVMKEQNEKPIAEEDVAALVSLLRSCSATALQRNYTVSSNVVTLASVTKARNILGELSQVFLDSNKSQDFLCKKFNGLLLDLFAVIPRKMRYVQAYLLSDNYSSFRECIRASSVILQREQNLLDVMESDVIQRKSLNDVAQKTGTPDKTILELLGLRIRALPVDAVSQIQEDLTKNVHRYQIDSVFSVTNDKTQKSYDEFVESQSIPEQEQRLLWHGSRNENWWGILDRGLLIRSGAGIAHGSMFGRGLYYAVDPEKSVGYTSLSGARWENGSDNIGFLGLFSVALGKSYEIQNGHANSSLNFEYLQQGGGYHSTYAHGGKGGLMRDEIIVYQEKQTTIKYLVKLRTKGGD